MPAFPHESEYGGGKAYVSAPYNGGKSILEPEVPKKKVIITFIV